jgi:uncharacterized membrane protein (UPF0127 family)
MARKKDALSWGVVALVLLAVAGAAAYVMWPQLQPHTMLHIGDGVFTARVLKTPTERAASLHEARKLRDDQAVIFVYDSDQKWPATSEGNSEAIDIVWLDKDKRVTYIVKNVPPESSPYDTFVPKQEARFVVQLPGGMVTRKAISIGSVAAFDENRLEGWGK